MGGAESCRTLSKRSEHPHVGRWHRSSLVLRSKSRGRSSTTPAQKKQLTCDFRWHGIDVSGTSKVVMGDRSSVNVAEKCSTTTVLQMHLCFRRSASFRRDGQLALVCIRNGPNGPFVSSDVGVHCRQHHVLLVGYRQLTLCPATSRSSQTSTAHLWTSLLWLSLSRKVALRLGLLLTGHDGSHAFGGHVLGISGARNLAGCGYRAQSHHGRYVQDSPLVALTDTHDRLSAPRRSVGAASTVPTQCKITALQTSVVCHSQRRRFRENSQSVSLVLRLLTCATI